MKKRTCIPFNIEICLQKVFLFGTSYAIKSTFKLFKMLEKQFYYGVTGCQHILNKEEKHKSFLGFGGISESPMHA